MRIIDWSSDVCSSDLVVGPGNKVQKRVIDTVRTVGDRWLVSRGLRPGDKLVVDGLIRVSPGDVVKPVALGLPSKRTEERRGGIRDVSQCRYWWSSYL